MIKYIITAHITLSKRSSLSKPSVRMYTRIIPSNVNRSVQKVYNHIFEIRSIGEWEKWVRVQSADDAWATLEFDDGEDGFYHMMMVSFYRNYIVIDGYRRLDISSESDANDAIAFIQRELCG